MSQQLVNMCFMSAQIGFLTIGQGEEETLASSQ